MVDPNHECFKWEWKVEEGGIKSFIFSIKDGVFGYTMSGGGFNKWWSSVEELERGMEGWYKVRSIELCGPTLPPICVKIRQMEARWKKFQEQKRELLLKEKAAAKKIMKRFKRFEGQPYYVQFQDRWG